MTTYFPFAPRPRQSFVFQPVLDGAARRAEVRWSLFGQRWYVTVSPLSGGGAVFTLPVVGSDDPLAVASAAWDGTRERVVAVTSAPHGIPVGSEALITFRGFSPTAFDGEFLCAALDPTTLVYPQQADPGAAIVLGTAATEVDLASGYFSSSLVYRTSARRFEVEP